MADCPVIALVDGEHHPAAVRDALDRLDADRGVAAAVFCGGGEKVTAAVLADAPTHYGRALTVADDPADALRSAARDAPDARVVVDLADEPVLHHEERMRLAAHALALGMRYEAPGMVLEPPPLEDVAFPGPRLAVIATGKRSGKTAVAGHWAGLLRAAGASPVVVCMGRGGPARPEIARAGTALEELLRIADAGGHAASDHLEGAALAGVDTVGCRRVGGGPAGQPAESTVPEGVRLAAGLGADALIVEGSGAVLPPVAVERTVCLVARPPVGLDHLRLLRADLVLAVHGTEPPPGALRCELRPEPAEPPPGGARVALFTTGATACAGVEPVMASANLARREALEADLDAAAAERCDVYLTELKAAAIDAVARRARDEGARVIFVRNRPVGLDGDLDAALVKLYADA